MAQHPALCSGNVAVITGGADGIGLAAAHYYKSLGMEVCLADIDAEKLEQARDDLGEILTVVTDVSQLSDVQELKRQAYARYERVDVLMNNAGVASHCGSWSEYDAWKAVIDVNLWGVINGTHSLRPCDDRTGESGADNQHLFKTGYYHSPGNPAYNVSKAGVKAITEALQHNLRNTEDCKLSAHLLIPGFTYTGMVKAFLPENPTAPGHRSRWSCLWRNRWPMETSIFSAPTMTLTVNWTTSAWPGPWAT